MATSANASPSASYAIFAAAREFYLWDACVGPDASACARDDGTRLGTAPQLVVVRTRDAALVVDFELAEREPAPAATAGDEVAEAALELISGVLELHECVGRSIARFHLVPGRYRVRASFGAAQGATAGGCRLVVWPAPR